MKTKLNFYSPLTGFLAWSMTATTPFASAAGFPNRLELALHGQANTNYRVEASTDLKHWAAVATNRTTPTGALSFRDPQAGQFPQRFYRGTQMTGTGTLSSQGLMGQNYAPNKILVKPRAGVNLSRLNLSLGVTVLNTFSKIGNLQIMKVPGNLTSSTLISLYQQSGLVEYAEHDFYVQVLNDPNDPRYVNGDLWDLKNLGQYGGTPGADIRAPLAWDTTTSASSVIVAVIDTGVRYTHEDLAANMWVNPADGSHGTNTVAGNSDPNDDYGHGTHVSGTIGAAGNNGLGIVGVCWSVQIMALKFLDPTGNGTISDAILCMDYARTHGAKVCNASWGATTFTSQALHDAIASLRDADIVFVAAAGNSAANNDTTPLYPASYRDLDNVVAVAATDRNDQLASFSDYGMNSVDLAAPGTPIMSCWNGSDSDYQDDDGTSMACAHVTGAVALLRGYYPNENYKQTIQRIVNGTDPLPSLAGKTISGGRLDLAKALGSVAPPALTANFTANPGSGPAPLTVQFTDTSTGNPTSWNWNFGDGATSATQNPSHTFNAAGNFAVTLTVANGTGQTSSASRTITATNATQTAVTANFSATPNSGQAPLAVQFIDLSSGPVTAWSWNFGDGASSTTQSPNHTYSNTGTFTATLIVTGSSGQTDNASQIITVTNATVQPVTANFAASPTSGQAPLAVQFTDQSSGPVTSWSWNFGDGATSTTQSPNHTYNSAGNFTATLTVSGSSGQTSSASRPIMVTNAPAPVTANFAANPTSGQAPLAVQFTDQSSGPVTSWSWNFGDGATSTTQSPNHTYNSAGNFTAKLTVSGSSGQSSSASRTITVTNAPTPVTANFAANPTTGQAPLAVQFTDQSSGSITAWNWSFGDGATSSTQNPSHVYNSAGSFIATLTVSGSKGQTSSASRTITVTNAPAPVTANFAANPTTGQAPLAVQFTDQSSGSITAWSWNFGDDATSTTQNPSHVYNSTGSFTATLTVSGSSGQTSSASRTITVTNVPPPPSTVTVVASQPLASILSPGVFTVTRTGNTSSPLTVNYSLGGTARNGVDYQTLSGSAVIPAGSLSTTVVVRPQGLLTLLKTVVLTLSSNSNYTVGSPGSATVKILVEVGGL